MRILFDIFNIVILKMTTYYNLLYIILLTLTIIIVISLLCARRKSREGFRNKREDDTIFVSIANYRDDDCKNTLTHLYNTAKHPQKIFVGVLSQYKTPTESCEVKGLAYSYNIRYMNVAESAAKGPLFARIHIIDNLFNGEKYFLMIDAHTRFTKNWDSKVIKQLKYLQTKGISKPILSTYPRTYDDYKSGDTTTTVICKIIGGDVMPTVLAAENSKKNVFTQSYFVSGGCTFTLGTFINNIKLDTRLKHVFGGEELLFSILAYTHGWDIYSFAVNLFYHHYGHGKPTWHADLAKTIATKNTYSSEIASSTKILEKLLTNPDYKTAYGLGTVRTLMDFYKTIGWKLPGTTFKDHWAKDNRKLCTDTRTIEYN